VALTLVFDGVDPLFSDPSADRGNQGLSCARISPGLWASLCTLT
jgi:hypothetical protein